MKIVVDTDTCTGCGLCVDACPTLALTMVGDKAEVDMRRCDLDGICIPVCPVQAISFDES